MGRVAATLQPVITMRVPPNPVNSQHTADNAVAAARAASNLSVALSALARRPPGADIRI